jgi:hypothetical protein
MVGLEVEEHGNVARELVHVLELEGRQLADDPVGALDRRERDADVAGDRDVTAGRGEDRAEKRRRRRLAVRAGDADELRPARSEPVVPELDLGPDRYPALARRDDERPVAGNAGCLDEHVDPVQQREVLLVAERPVDEHRIAEPARDGAARSCGPVHQDSHTPRN